MADRSEATITIDASPAEIMAVVADFEHYPAWAGVRSATVLAEGSDGRAEEVNLVIDAGFVKDDYVLRYRWDGDREVSWSLVRGKMQKSQEGTYTLTSAGEATQVRYRLTVDVVVPLIGPLKRKAERTIMDTALKGLKKRVESLR